MNYQTFLTYIKDNISKRLTDGRSVRLEAITKNNGMVYDGLIIIDPFINISPTIYLNEYYYQYLSGTSLTDICNTVFSAYEKNLPTKNFDISLFKDFSKAKSRIVMKLINYESNLDSLQKIPHIPYLDLAIIFVCYIQELNQDFATILIQNSHLNLWKTDKDTLYEIAQKNTPILLPPIFEPMANALADSADNKNPIFEELPLYILTNEKKVNGAATILYKDLLEECANKCNCDFILLPSSIHEVILIPVDTSTRNAFDYNQIIQNVNASQLTADEILADHAYYYDRKTKQLTM